MEYQNFDIRIRNIQSDGSYPVEVVRSPAGGTNEVPQKLKIDEIFVDFLTYVRGLIAHSTDVKELGDRFCDFLFPQEISQKFAESRIRCAEISKGLRIRLQIDPPALLDFPWEYCTDIQNPHFSLSYRPQIAITRYLKTHPEENFTISEPVKILVAIANPSNTLKLDSAGEEAAIRKSLAILGSRAELEILAPATKGSFRDKLINFKPQVVHFIGHGILDNQKGGAICLDGQLGSNYWYSQQMATAFIERGVKLVILNACHTARHSPTNGSESNPINNIAYALFEAGVPSIIAMQAPISDKPAAAFAQEIYAQLAKGEPVEVALTETRNKEYSIENNPIVWGIPVLYSRVENAVFWHSTPPSPPEPPDPPKLGVPDPLRRYLDEIANYANSFPQLINQYTASIKIEDIYVPLNVKESNEPVLKHIYQNKHLVLLGEAGSGKSTLLNQLTRSLAKSILSAQTQITDNLLNWEIQIRTPKSIPKKEYWAEMLPTPVLINLTDFVKQPLSLSSYSFIEHACSQIRSNDGEVHDILRKKFKNKELIFLLDGIELLTNKQQETVWNALRWLVNSEMYGNNRCIVVCRASSFNESKCPIHKDQIFHLESLEEKEITNLTRNLKENLIPNSKQEIKDQIDTLVFNLQKDSELQPLIKNPFFLTTLILNQIVNSDNEHNEPYLKHRVHIYNSYLELLLREWNKYQLEIVEFTDDIKHIIIPSLYKPLQEVAWQMQLNSLSQETKYPSISKPLMSEVIEKHLTPPNASKAFLRFTIDQNILTETPDNHFAFNAPIIQKYLAALHLACSSRFHREVGELSEKKSSEHNIILLASEQLLYSQSPEKYAIEKIIDAAEKVLPLQEPHPQDTSGWKQVLLAAEMIKNLDIKIIVNDKYGKHLLSSLQNLLIALFSTSYLLPQLKAKAGEILGILGDHRAGVIGDLPEMVPFIVNHINNKEYSLAISRYPITNSQYKYFIEDGGYTNKWSHCWEEEGANYLLHLKSPYYWDDPKWQDWQAENKPVIGVSWYEAHAYTRWLSEKHDRKFRVPRQEEWLEAANQVNRVPFQWSHDWEEFIMSSVDKKNTQSPPSKTLTVGCLPNLPNSLNIYDLGGNIWEWCDSDSEMLPSSDAIALPKIILGGPFSPDLDVFRQDSALAISRQEIRGFRVVEDLPHH